MGCWQSIDYYPLNKNPPFSVRSNGTEAKKDQYLDRNDYNAHDRTRMRSPALIKPKEQDAIFDGIMLTRPFSAFSCHNKVEFFSLAECDSIELDIEPRGLHYNPNVCLEHGELRAYSY